MIKLGSSRPTFSPEEGILPIYDFIRQIASVELPKFNTNKNIAYYNIPAAFDIEVSSFYQNGEKRSCMYIWQFGILNWVTAGRTWGEFLFLMDAMKTILELSDSTRLIVYVHNLAYEFQFMRKRFGWDKLFFLDERKPVYALTGGIEFRCSLKLSGKSLEKVGNDLQKYKVHKKIGDLDYQLVRTPQTPISVTELGYCEGDIRVLLAYIQEKIETDGNITRIPLTNTGYVREYCRKNCFIKYNKYHRLMQALTLTPDEYSQLKRGFSGGFTHASAKYVGKILNNVGSFDFTSSYPAVMIMEKFPMSRAKLVENVKDKSELMYYLKNYCCLIDITYHSLVPKLNYDHPISQSRLSSSKGCVLDNGRVVSAFSVTLTCTEQDFFVYDEFYDYEEIEIHTLRIYEKAYLPTKFVKAILKLYKDKTQLKGVEGEEINYMLSKCMLNSAYGMAVTDIVRDEVIYDNDTGFGTKKPDVNEAIKKYNEGKKRFLFYPWGVWVTAYARANLFSGIIACGDDYVYADTDSIKVLNVERHMDYINRYNAEVEEKLERAAEFHGIDPMEFSPLNRKGEPKPIGVWDYEGQYDEFKTLGAKRYMTKRDGKYSLTVAGVNKKKACDYLVKTYANPMDGLTDKLIVPEEYSGRLTSTYIDEPTSGIVTDYLGNTAEFSELSSIHMEPSKYELTMSDDFKRFLDYLKGYKEDSW